MDGKSFLIDTTKCTACRGCQIACKEWNKLPAGETKQTGTFQNPPDLSASTYRLVRFQEYPSEKNYMVWYFFTEACRHCMSPPCKTEADKYVKDCITVDKNGGVQFNEKTKELGANAEKVKAGCPYNIPRLNEATKALVKCHMCYMRVDAGLLPACVKSCPTGALNFGERNDILKLAQTRLAEAKKKFGDKAELINPDEVRAIFLVADTPAKYCEFATY
ncbi:MAG: formate dehydrogenase [Deltaproteobacteria bacterium]|nr:formate dehydrogenase [Deltaproteobacteria bacterium]